MQTLPVLDLLEGTVVRGVAGDRGRYRPIESGITDRTDPLGVASALRDRFGLAELYVADLDGILHGRPNLATYASLREAGFRLLVDAGVRSQNDARQILEHGADSLIVCLETNPPASLRRGLLAEFGPERLIFSIDLQAGRPLGRLDDECDNVPELIDRVVADGFRRLIVLDLAAVGVDGGPATLSLCQETKARHPHLQLITGGGVRGPADLELLQAAGVDGVLIASALHSGALTPDDLGRLE